MAKFLRIYCTLMITLILSSCEEDFALVKPAFTPSIVVNSVFTVGEPWVVNLSLSRDILENGSTMPFVENAEVVVIDQSNGRRIYLSYVGDGNYRSKIYTPIVERRYELEVNVPGYDVISATSTPPKFSEVTISDVVESELDKSTTVDFHINDVQNGFYIWNLIISSPSNPIDTFYTGSPSKLISSVNYYNQLAGLVELIGSPVNDAEASGGEFSTTHLDFQPASDSTVILQTKRYLRLLTASKELYSYYKSVDRFNENPIGSSISYSTDIYSNIKGGLGIFAGFSEKYHEIK